MQTSYMRMAWVWVFCGHAHTSRLLAFGLLLMPRLISLMLPCSRVSYRDFGSFGGSFTNMDMARSAKLSLFAWMHKGQTKCIGERINW